MITNIKVTYRATVQHAIDVAVPGWHAVKQCTVESNVLRVTTHDGGVLAFNLPEPGAVDITEPDTIHITDTAGKQLPPWGGSIPHGELLSTYKHGGIPSAYLRLHEPAGESQRLDFTVYDARTADLRRLAEFDLGEHWMIYKPHRLTPGIDQRLQALVLDDWLAYTCGAAITSLLKLERSVHAPTVKYDTTQGDLSAAEIARAILSILGLTGD